MLSTARSRLILILVSLVVIVIVGSAVAAVLEAPFLAPVRTASAFPWRALVEEAEIKNRCVKCHEPARYHTCDSCHDAHGSAEMAAVPFNTLLALTGDVPEPDYIPVNEILPYRDQPHTHVALLDFLAEHGVADFESVTLASTDGGFVTFERQYLTSEALLMPHVDGIRFAARDLHVSTWLKGITRVIVVGKERPLRIDGEATSMGRLLLGPTRSVTAQQTDVMLKSEEDGQVRRGKTAFRMEGAPIGAIVAHADFQRLLVRDANGRERALAAEDARGAILAQVRSQVVLVLPERGRPQWIEDVVEIESQR